MFLFVRDDSFLRCVLCGLLWFWAGQTFAVSSQSPVVLLISQSSEQAIVASQHIQQGVRTVLGANVPLAVVDPSDYATMASAWRAVMAYQPKAVIGPLYKDELSALIGLKPTIPVIALNSTDRDYVNVWQLAVKSEQPVYQLALHLADKGIDHLLILRHDSEQARRLWQGFSEVSDSKVEDQVIYRHSDQLLAGISVLLGSSKGKKRILELEHLLATPIVSNPWMRQDADAVLVFAPLADALSLSYQVDYLWGQDLSLYWVDTGNNPLNEYVRSASSWGRMMTFMPTYQLLSMQGKRSAKQDFFMALGEDAARLLQLRLVQPEWSEHQVIEGSLGALSFDHRSGHINIHWPLVWLGDGVVDVLPTADQ